MLDFHFLLGTDGPLICDFEHPYPIDRNEGWLELALEMEHPQETTAARPTT